MATKFYCLEPDLKVSNETFYLVIIFVFCWFITNWLYVYVNWETEKCNNGRLFFAPLFFKDTNDAFQQCTSDIVNNAINDKNISLASSIDKLNQNLSGNSNNLKTAINGTISHNEKSLNNSYGIISKMQDNFKGMHDNLSNILKSLLLNTHMNEGVLKSVGNISVETIANDTSMQKLNKANVLV